MIFLCLSSNSVTNVNSRHFNGEIDEEALPYYLTTRPHTLCEIQMLAMAEPLSFSITKWNGCWKLDMPSILGQFNDNPVKLWVPRFQTNPCRQQSSKELIPGQVPVEAKFCDSTAMAVKFVRTQTWLIRQKSSTNRLFFLPQKKYVKCVLFETKDNCFST